MTACLLTVLISGCGGGGSTVSAPGEPTADVTAAVSGARFADPAGAYTIMVAGGWLRVPSSLVGDGVVWWIDKPVNDFAPNVNVTTQQTPGVDLGGYLRSSEAGMSGMTVLQHRLIRTPDGRTLGELEYAGVDPSGSSKARMHFLAVFDVAGGRTVLATLTTPDDATFSQRRAAAEPFRATLHAR